MNCASSTRNYTELPGIGTGIAAAGTEGCQLQVFWVFDRVPANCPFVLQGASSAVSSNPAEAASDRRHSGALRLTSIRASTTPSGLAKNLCGERTLVRVALDTDQAGTRSYCQHER